MRIGFLVERPTQFEAPFYRYASTAGGGELRVLFSSAHPAAPVFDPELGREVTWGFDLLAGFDHATLPPRGRARWLAEELRRARYDLLIVNGYTQPAYLLGAGVARRLGVATALRLDSVLEGGRPARRWRKLLLLRAVLMPLYRLFLGVGTRTLEYLRSFGVPEARIGMFPYAVDVETFRARSALSTDQRVAARRRLGVPEDAQVVLSVAKLAEREAPWDLLRAAELIAADHTWLLIAGDGPQRRELEAWQQDKSSHVRFLGYVPYPQLPALYAAADVFVHPAREERWGVSVAEAMACGLPVVASENVGAAADLVRVGSNGATYPAGDFAALADRLRAVLALPRQTVLATNREILERWDYASTWRGLLRAAEAVQ